MARTQELTEATTDAERARATGTHHRQLSCGRCKATLVVWRHAGETETVSRGLALADHLSEVHAKPLRDAWKR